MNGDGDCNNNKKKYTNDVIEVSFCQLIHNELQK